MLENQLYMPGMKSQELEYVLATQTLNAIWDKNPLLDGNVRLRIDKSTPNTTIMDEDIGPIRNSYIHHDKGPGRLQIKIFDKTYDNSDDLYK